MERIQRRRRGGGRVIEAYLDRFTEELEGRGVAGRDRRRVLAETEDHLRELAAEHGEEAAVSRFGQGGPLAVAIAAQLATSKTIRSTYATFAALATTAFGYIALLAIVHLDGGPPDLFSADHEALGVLAALGLLLFPQIAFVAGGLALLRALRRRGRGVLSCQELDVMRRRSAVALGAGGLTVCSMALWALEFRDLAPILALSLATALPLGVVTVAVVQASGTQAVSHGPPDDVFDDLRLAGIRAHPWLFALVVASAVAAVAFAVDGLILAGLEFAAVLAGFSLLGRLLALRK